MSMKRFVIYSICFLLCSVYGFSQKRQIGPQFPGGIQELRKGLKENLKKEFKDFEEHPATVRINFSVTKKGRPFNGSAPDFTDPKVQKKIAKAVRRLPRFKPGSANGVAILSDISIEIDLRN